MGKNTLKRSLIVGIVFLFLSTTSIPVLASEGKPDFVIENIFLWPDNQPPTYHFECSVRNIGNASELRNDFELYVRIKFLLFGKIPLFTIDSDTHSAHMEGIILPNRTITFGVASCDKLPIFGSYRFSLVFNPNFKVEESNYDNNKYSEDWKVFLWDWKEI